MRRLVIYLKDLLNVLFDRYWDIKLGIDTQGVHPTGASTKFGDNVECNPTSYRLLIKVLNNLPADSAEAEVIVDYGCGKGRAVCFLAQRAFKKIIGVEVSPVWAEYAGKNVSQLLGRKTKDIAIVREDAATFDPDEGTIFYFFNPFGADTFKAVLDKIHASILSKPRRIIIVYYNAVCKEAIDKETWLNHKKVIHRDREGNPAIVLYTSI